MKSGASEHQWVLINLVPKNSMEDVNDCRPISLTNVCLKFLTKLVANRLQDHILKCIHKNHYGFIRTRSFQDDIAWTYEYIYHCQRSKKPILIVKLDFAKSFDTIEHDAILQIFEHKGFHSTWLDGISSKQFISKQSLW
jgi:hypothetical protein